MGHNMKQREYYALDIPSIHRYAVGFDELFDMLSKTARTSNVTNGGNYPPYNIVRESDTRYNIEIAVAGFNENELDIEVVENELVVKGAHIKKQDLTEYVHHGISNRDFVRVFALAFNVEVKGASVKNGILTVSLEYIIPESAKPTKIAIAFQQ
jgi:molecular chaperone IbpA